MNDGARRRSPVRPGDIVAGKYRVDRILGAGGMGVVVAASHIELGQRVALKFILPEAIHGRDTVERFFREARASARLNSEHVARVFDVSRADEEIPYMVLELLEGEDLAQLDRSKGPLPVADTVEYLLQACSGLVDAHGAGIVHRDLKPQNLFVTRRPNGQPLVKVLDFGIAKAIGTAAVGQVTLTDSKAVIGSPLYMPPEQMRSSRIADPRSDIWSMGVMLYQLIGRKLPFDGETVTEICVAVINETPTPLLQLRPGLDPDLVDVIMKCLEKQPESRFQNVAQLGAALEPFATSTQRGGIVRPWRSLEQTGLSSGVTGPVSAPGSLPPPNAETGMSSPVSTPNPYTQMLPTGYVPPLSVGSRMAQTDITSAADKGPSLAPSRPSFAKGMIAGVIVSVGVVAGALAILVPRLKQEPAAPAVAPPIVSTIIITEPAPPPPPAPSPTVEAPKPAPAPASTGRRKGRPAAPAPAPPPSATVEPPKAEPKPPLDAPNGAPILR